MTIFAIRRPHGGCRLAGRFRIFVPGMIAVLFLISASSVAQIPDEQTGNVRSSAARETVQKAENGTWPHVRRVLLLRDYNTRVVTIGTGVLGMAAGLVGTFVLLRKRSLIGDVVGHASLPGIAVAFILVELFFPGHGKSLSGLLAGAALAGFAGIGCITLILRWTRLKEDAALAIVLSVFFGLGMVLFTIIQDLPTGSAAGLNHFIFGAAASMTTRDVQLILYAALAVLGVCVLFFKELGLLCFDDAFAASQGWPTLLLDLLLMGLVVAVTEIGAQSVGLILVVALMVIPAAAARFWVEDLWPMALVSTFLGGLGAYLGVMVSALLPKFAAGAVIVLASGCLFAVSFLAGSRRGVLWRIWEHRRLQIRVGRYDLMRACYEYLESSQGSFSPEVDNTSTKRRIPFEHLLEMRTWPPSRLRRIINRATREGLLNRAEPDLYELTDEGSRAAFLAARNHRLWETYLIRHAEIAASHVDHSADRIEHVLEPGLVRELEQELEKQFPHLAMPSSPHLLKQEGTVKASPTEESLAAKEP